MRIERRKKGEVEVPLASLADIAFLLIIFFVITAQFMKESNIEYDLPKDPDLGKVEKTPIFVTIDDQGIIYLNGEEISEDAVEGAVAAELSAAGVDIVHFKCDANISRLTFEPVLVGIADAGGTIVPIADVGSPQLR